LIATRQSIAGTGTDEIAVQTVRGSSFLVNLNPARADAMLDDTTLQSTAPPPPQTLDERISRLQSLLIAHNLADDKMLERAGRVAAESGRRLDLVLTQLGIVSEKDLARTLASLLQVPVTPSDRYPREPVFPERLRAKFLRKAHAVPIGVEAGRLVVAMSHPLDGFTAAAIAAAVRMPVVTEVAIPVELEAALDRLYPDSATSNAGAPENDYAGHDGLEDDTERLKDLASGAPVIRLVNQMIGRAVESQASDIHIEPTEDRLRVRYRFDGVLHEEESPPARLSAAIVSRIKIMAKLDIAERRLPQDGRLKLTVRGQEVDFRVSTVPSLYGETVVLRILDRNAVDLDFLNLGLPPAISERLISSLSLPNGIVLVTGPTGSGKTTTLYTGLLQMDSVARKIVTVEDPIEYQLGGVNQIQVKPQIGLNFASLLRSILRQDPDVIMVGEIRDIETAQIAVQAALTGHLVLSTLHTNSAAATITRLRDMGLEDYLITAVLRGVLAQRLVRRLCASCRQSYTAPDELIEGFSLDQRTNAWPIKLWRAVGCPQCRQTGYRGRQAIAEFLVPNEEIEHLIFARADHVAIERAAVNAGMVTMFNAGLDAALEGTTTIEEVVRSIRAEA
jgi:general secretion pathway protein E